MTNLRVGLIGAGSALRALYGPAMGCVEGMELAAAADPDPRAREEARTHWGVKAAYPSAEEMVGAGGLEAVIVASPPFCHREHVEMAAHAGLHILVEKPMARTVSEAEAMIAACEQAGALLLVGFNRRYIPPLAAATRMAHTGALGRVYATECLWTSWTCDYGGGWRDSARCLGGNFQDHGAHSFDLAAQWLGPIAAVSAEAQCVGPLAGSGREVEDHMMVMARHASGATSLHYHSRCSHRPVSEVHRIHGTEGTLELEYTGGWAAMEDGAWDVRLYRLGRLSDESVTAPHAAPGGHGDLSDAKYAVYAEIQNFAELIRGGRRSGEPSGWAGLAAARAVAAALLSALEGRRVPLEEADRFDAERYRSLMATLGIEVCGGLE